MIQLILNICAQFSFLLESTVPKNHTTCIYAFEAYKNWFDVEGTQVCIDRMTYLLTWNCYENKGIDFHS